MKKPYCPKMITRQIHLPPSSNAEPSKDFPTGSQVSFFVVFSFFFLSLSPSCSLSIVPGLGLLNTLARYPVLTAALPKSSHHEELCHHRELCIWET